MTSYYRWTIILTAALFAFLVMRQVSRPVDDTKWTYFDLIIIAAILFIVIWIYPDIRDIILRWRRRNKTGE
jgi:predicted tellurium resistance membrane protein TerC